ncbi:MAG: hypothetical protein AAF800_14250, partial [Planctomycetota bacterium]
GWPQQSHPGRDGLFDLMLDPWERRDVSDDARYAEVYDDLDRRLRTWQADTADAVTGDGIDLPPRQEPSARPKSPAPA